METEADIANPPASSRAMAVFSQPLSRRRVLDATYWAWHSQRFFAVALLLLAVFIGAHYRFHKLQRWDMNGDEGNAWAAVVRPTVRQVVATFWRKENGGKLPVFHILLHQWVRIFGDSLFALRAMSALLGTLAIVLLFAAVRETCRSLGDGAVAELGEVGGAFAALMYALNLTIVVSDRTAREFPLLIVAELLQIIFFVRAQRHSAWTNYAGTAGFTALMLATNYSSAFLLLAEALWCGCTLVARWAGSVRVREIAIFSPGIAVIGGMALLSPLLPRIFVISHQAVEQGAVSWIKLQPPSWPLTVFSDVAGRYMIFPLYFVLIMFGVGSQWRSGRLAWGFLAAWMLGPVLAVFLISYMIQPMEFPRYVLIAFVGMFALAGFGAGCVRSTFVRILLAVTIVHYNVPPLRNWLKVLRDGAWAEATALADRNAPNSQIAVSPQSNLDVVRFYLPPGRRRDAVPMYDKCGPAPVVILSGRGFMPDAQVAETEACYPRILAQLNLVEVRGR